MRRFLAGLVLGGGLVWLAFFATDKGYSVVWYHGILATCGVLLTAAGVELYLRLRAERELRAARISLSFLGISGLVLLALAFVLAVV